jgi:U3 small nucleolar RNA-associated protein 13
MSDILQPKAVYEAISKVEAFYTGGAVRVTRDNQHIACACGDEVKVSGRLVSLFACRHC